MNERTEIRPTRPGTGRPRDSRAARLLSLVAISFSLLVPRAAAGERHPDWRAVGEETAHLLSEYIRIDTQNPPGRTVEAVDLLEARLRAAGVETERLGAIPEKPILFARLRGSGTRGARPIVLLNHMDVVPAASGKWSVPPLSGEVRDHMLYGRGALDMKGLGTIQLMAVKLLAESGAPLKRDVILLAVPDGETGTAGLAWLAEKRPDIFDVDAVWGDGAFGVTDAHLAPTMTFLFVSAAEKAALQVRLVVEGPSGNAARSAADFAPQRLQQALDRILSRPAAPRITPVMRASLRRMGAAIGGTLGIGLANADNPVVWPGIRASLQRDPYMSAKIRDTTTVTSLKADGTPGVVPGRAEAILDCRLLPGSSEKLFLAELARVVRDPAVRIEVISSSRESPASPTSHPLLAAMETVAKSVFPKAVLAPTLSADATDLRFFRQRNVPAYGFVPVRLPQRIRATEHGDDERIPTAELGPAVRFVYETLERF